MVKKEILLYDNGNELPEEGEFVVNILGAKRYEITNYLGNVNAVITDRKVYAAPSNTIAIYEAVVVLKADYYPFGMTMPGRHESGEGYRFGYNGMEINPEVSGDGNSYTTEFRQYDPRLGRWLSLDPLMAMFPWMSPYVAFDNNPVFFVDPLGLAATNGGDKGKPKDERGSGSLDTQGGGWNSVDLSGYGFNKETNISKALSRLNIGGITQLTNDQKGTVEVCTYVCTKSDNYQENEYYPDFTFTRDYKNELREDENTFPEPYIYMEVVTNSFIVRKNYVYHKQVIKRKYIHFDWETGEIKGTDIDIKIIEEKQYFKKTINKFDKILDPHKFYKREKKIYGNFKKINEKITDKMKKLIDEVVHQYRSMKYQFDFMGQGFEDDQDFYESTKELETQPENLNPESIK